MFQRRGRGRPILPSIIAWSVLIILSIGGAARAQEGGSAQALKLVPYPKKIELRTGRMVLPERARLCVTTGGVIVHQAAAIQEDLSRFGKVACEVSTVPASKDPPGFVLCLSAEPVGADRLGDLLKDPPAQDEGYVLIITPDLAAIGSRAEAGLGIGVQTLRQLVRGHLQDRSLPCLKISDWPALRYRGYSDDITRGPSPLLRTFEHELKTTALLKMNFFSYYLEHQYAFARNPVIGPKDGSLTPQELAGLVELAGREGVEVFGNQQSFGHFGHILKHAQYKPLAETSEVLNPTIEGTYKLLDEMYSEQIPLLKAGFFNVCCDETDGLGTGPAKAEAEKLGVGGLYVQHILRVHQLITGKYGKRMMMWGDIILRHPEHLPKIPKDTVMLSWGYDPRGSFEEAITPFSKSGYQFFVCPGVSCWSRILPDFGVAVTNIRNYVRDGVKLGALGMWNTTWDDDGENFFAVNWHGVAWGAECAWSGSATSPEDFNRRIGAVLFGERGDRFGRAVEGLARAHRLPNYEQMMDGRFWRVDQDMGMLPVDEATAVQQARSLLGIVDPALEQLRALQTEARFNGYLIDFHVFGAERMRLMATRSLGYLAAAAAYGKAVMSDAGSPEAREQLKEADREIRKVRDEHAAMKARYAELWNRENKPYALEPVLGRFDRLIGVYDGILKRLDGAAQAAAAGKGLPTAAAAGLDVVEMGVRRTKPNKVNAQSLLPDAPWVDEPFDHRMGLVIGSGATSRVDLPVEVDLPAGVGTNTTVRLFEINPQTLAQTPVACQRRSVGLTPRLAFVVRGTMEKGASRHFLLYYGAGVASVPPRDPAAVHYAHEPNGVIRIENDQVSLRIGPEGGHIYRWEVKGLGNRDLTEPGETGWAGFADCYGPHRSAAHRLEVLDAGPAMVRVRCIGAEGLEKLITLYAGVPWAEVTLNSGQSWFWCYDDIAVMGADSGTPGEWLFSDRTSGKVRKITQTPDCQARRGHVQWGCKFARGGPMLALITPESVAHHVVGPGSGMGGVGIEGSPQSISHFVIYGGPCPTQPKDVLDALRATLDYRTPPVVELCALQMR